MIEILRNHITPGKLVLTHHINDQNHPEMLILTTILMNKTTMRSNAVPENFVSMMKGCTLKR